MRRFGQCPDDEQTEKKPTVTISVICVCMYCDRVYHLIIEELISLLARSSRRQREGISICT